MKRILMMAMFLVGLFLTFVACGGDDTITCDDMKERCMQKCREQGMEPVVGECSRMADYPRVPCSCSLTPSGSLPNPLETQAWNQW